MLCWIQYRDVHYIHYTTLLLSTILSVAGPCVAGAGLPACLPARPLLHKGSKRRRREETHSPAQEERPPSTHRKPIVVPTQYKGTDSVWCMAREGCMPSCSQQSCGRVEWGVAGRVWQLFRGASGTRIGNCGGDRHCRSRSNTHTLSRRSRSGTAASPSACCTSSSPTDHHLLPFVIASALLPPIFAVVSEAKLSIRYDLGSII